VLVADASKMRAATGWQPRHSQLDVIVDTALIGQRRLIRHPEPIAQIPVTPVPVEPVAVAVAPATPAFTPHPAAVLAAAPGAAIDPQGPSVAGLAQLK